jgi:hypothetical protein
MATKPANDTDASTMAMIQISRGLTPPQGPIGRSGTIGNAIKVIASNTSTDWNSGSVIFFTHACRSSRTISTPVAATAAPAAMSTSPNKA